MDSDRSEYDRSPPDSDCEPEICYRRFYGPPVECAWEDNKGTTKIAVARVPLILLPAIAERLQGGRAAPASAYMRRSLPRAWMIAIAQQFPDTPLAKLRSADPSLLPCWLLRCFHHYQDALVLRPEGIFARRPDAGQKRKRISRRQFIPAATLHCRFRVGFASEGMLCNNPPIPLRVLDFLEHTEDLLNLALVCKATHQAGHVLLQREFPGGLGPRPLTEGLLRKAIRQRKRGMLASALRHPIPTTTALTSTLAPTAETQACLSGDVKAQYPFHECTVDDIYFHQVYPCIHHLLVTILLARQGTLQDPAVPLSIPPTLEGLPHALNWHHLLLSGHAIVLDGDSVVRAAAELSKLKLGAPGEEERWLALRHEACLSMASCWHREEELEFAIIEDDWPKDGLWSIECAKEMFKVVQAAEREGQGIIVL